MKQQAVETNGLPWTNGEQAVHYRADWCPDGSAAHQRVGLAIQAETWWSGHPTARRPSRRRLGKRPAPSRR